MTKIEKTAAQQTEISAIIPRKKRLIDYKTPDNEMTINTMTDNKIAVNKTTDNKIGGNMEFTTDIFKQFDQKWGLVTAGDADSFNTMTVSWGGLGTLWSKPVATVYIRTSRYTHDFVDKNDYFTVSFYPAECRKVLAVLGSKSGREMDKMHDSGLTPVFLEKGVTFKEAEVTLVCRKLFKQQLSLENIPEEVTSVYYATDAPHDMYIGEVVEVL